MFIALNIGSDKTYEKSMLQYIKIFIVSPAKQKRDIGIAFPVASSFSAVA